MTDQQEEILIKIRERVLEREHQIRDREDREAQLEATLQALEEITDVPRSEMDRIAEEIRTAYENPVSERVEKTLVPVSQYEELPATVKDALSRLPGLLREEFWEEYRLQSRHTAISYLLWLIPPPFSCHYLYNRCHIRQILFFLTCGGLFIWWLVDLFRIPQLVQEENRKTARRILKKMLRYNLSSNRIKPA